MASSEGGMDIEEVAAQTPERIHKVKIDPVDGLTSEQAARGRPARSVFRMRRCLKPPNCCANLYRAFDETDASLVEINPLDPDRRRKGDGARCEDDTSTTTRCYRHPEIVALRDLDEEDPAEIEASKFGLCYISLDGNIGCLVNGAGLAMATMDIIKLYGGAPANFLDVGGGATTEKVTEAFKLMLRNPKVQGDTGEHLRWHHEMRCHRSRRGRCGAASEAGSAARRAPGGHQRGSGKEDSGGVGIADHLGRATWPMPLRRSLQPPV